MLIVVSLTTTIFTISKMAVTGTMMTIIKMIISIIYLRHGNRITEAGKILTPEVH